MSDLLAALRQSTASLHQGLHVHRLLAPLQDSTITLEDYYWCIRAFHQAYSQMQRSIRFTPPFADIAALQWLERDMLAHHITPVEIEALPYSPIDTASKYTGYLYVKQGSTLGGRVISRHLHRTLGLVEHESNHFFAGFGEETGARWKQFVSALDDANINTQEAVSQAVDTFRLIGHVCDTLHAIKQRAPT